MTETDIQQVLAHLPENFSMRDINDACVKCGLPSLAQGMIELPPPEILRRIAAEVAMDGSVHQYRSRAGETEALEAVHKLLRLHYGTPSAPGSVLMTQGVTSAVLATLLWVRSNRDNTKKAAIFDPFYTYHLKDVETVFGPEGAVLIRMDDQLLPSVENMETALAGDHTIGAVIVCNPGNPAGNVLSQELVQNLVNCCRKHGVVMIMDECYIDMIWQGFSHYSPVTMLDEHGCMPNDVVVCRGFSKVLGVQSWRVGYLVAHPSVASAICTVHDPVYICVPWTQHAIGRYLSNHLDDFELHKQSLASLMRENWVKLRDALVTATKWKAIEPSGSMYGIFKHHEESDMAAVKKVLELGVGVCPGSIFSAGKSLGFIRIHCGVNKLKADRVVAALSH